MHITIALTSQNSSFVNSESLITHLFKFLEAFFFFWWFNQVKKSACSAGYLGLIPGSGSYPGEGNGNPLQYSCLENPMEKGAWQATVHRFARVGHDQETKPSGNGFTMLC